MAEMIIPVPEPVEEGFQKLDGLTDDAFEELLGALESEQPSLSLMVLSDRLASQAKSLNRTDILDILATIVSFHSGRAFLDLAASDFVDGVLRDTDLKLTKTRKQKLRERVILLLGSKTLMLTGKGLDILGDHPNVFLGARILTDMRPIFDEDTSKGPLGAVLVHTLKLVFHSAGRHQEFYIALDTKDVAKLRRVLERADTKAEMLAQLLGSMNITHVEEAEEG